MEKHYRNAYQAWDDFARITKELIINKGFHTIGEIGGGANPLLEAGFIAANNLAYRVIDISAEELAKAGAYYVKVQADLEAEDFAAVQQNDFLFAQMTLEHISKPAVFYRNVYSMLKPGGYAFFFFACDTMLPARVNKWLPELVSDRILKKLQPFRKQEHHGKFKAFYRWCKGPTKKNTGRLSKTGLHIIAHTGYFGHSYYHRFPLLQRLENWKTSLLLKWPAPRLCSYSQVLLQKPLQ